jgi:hypothetical protein
MKCGTKSILFGIHQVFIHPVVVYKAWKHLYGKPAWRELICIIVHDWGYWGKPNLDGIEGTTHPELGAKLAGKLLGAEYEQMCLCHSRHYARELGLLPSKLCWADKLSFAYESSHLYLFRATLSGEIIELRRLAAEEGILPADQSNEEWFSIVKGFAIRMADEQDCKVFMHKKKEENTGESFLSNS